MLDYSPDDTIVAISTPPGFGGIGILRLSGKDSFRIAKSIFTPSAKKQKILPGRAVFGRLHDLESRLFLDEGFLLFFPSPRSYTREDIVEISCHGSPAVLEEALRLAARAGARPARPGEFTLRAYLKGRIDIIQAEAVNDLVFASSPRSAQIAFAQLEGKLSRKISELRSRTLELLSRLEAAIEFPDERLPVTAKKIFSPLEAMIGFLGRLISSYETGKALSEGLTLAIIGRKNVGKSTLFNSMLEEERAIVTRYPGTTRDYLKERIRIEDYYFTLVDMAGLGKPASRIEKEGIERGRKIASRADGLLLMLDVSRKESAEDLGLIEEYGGEKTLLLFNKIDLPRKMDTGRVKSLAKGMPALEISALRGTNLAKLKREVRKRFAPGPRESEDVIFHLRQKILLENALARMEKARELLSDGYPEDVCAEEIRQSLPAIEELTGEIRPDDVFERIFRKFCVGK